MAQLARDGYVQAVPAAPAGERHGGGGTGQGEGAPNSGASKKLFARALAQIEHPLQRAEPSVDRRVRRACLLAADGVARDEVRGDLDGPLPTERLAKVNQRVFDEAEGLATIHPVVAYDRRFEVGESGLFDV